MIWKSVTYLHTFKCYNSVLFSKWNIFKRHPGPCRGLAENRYSQNFILREEEWTFFSKNLLIIWHLTRFLFRIRNLESKFMFGEYLGVNITKCPKLFSREDWSRIGKRRETFYLVTVLEILSPWCLDGSTSN